MDPDGKEIALNDQWHHLHLDDEEKEKESPSTAVDNKILRMMTKMGYQYGLGLGKNKQGTTQPIIIEPQLTRRGLGLKIENLNYSNEDWDFSLENVEAIEEVEWLYSDSNKQIINNAMSFKEGQPITNIEEEHNFCDKDLLHDVVAAKNIFNELDLRELCQARARANPFETIRSVFFMNRAALKMANIDAATGFMFTNISENPHHKDDPGPYFFADVCAGPGGFTEYVLWRKSWQLKGFGFTLCGENDFRLTESVCVSPVTFLPLYGIHGDGNVCCPENIDDFKEKVLLETGQKGVHFMMSDGGFSVEGNENIQEILSKNIYICQCLVALEILRKHGHFVTKVFDMFTCFSVGLLYLIWNCFEKVCILKPNSSRPANSERYIICSNYKGRKDVHNIRSYLRKLVDRLWNLKNIVDLDITDIVPLDTLKNDHNFFSYIYNCNNRIAKCQTISLRKLATFCRNPLLLDHRQEELRKRCLEYWKIPDKPKVPLSKYTVDDLLVETVRNRELLLVQSREIYSTVHFEEILKNIQDWHYVPMQCRKTTNICNFYAGTGVGLSKTYRLQHNKWVKVKNVQLIRGTLLYGELVKENTSMKSQLSYKYSLHVIDALRLGDTSLADLTFEERHTLVTTYCKAVNHEFRTNTIRIRPKSVHRLDSIHKNLHLSKDEVLHNFIAQLPILGHNSEKEFYEVNSVLFLKTNKEQSFHSTYVLRLQFFINETNDQEEKRLSLEKLIKLVRLKK